MQQGGVDSQDEGPTEGGMPGVRLPGGQQGAGQFPLRPGQEFPAASCSR